MTVNEISTGRRIQQAATIIGAGVVAVLVVNLVIWIIGDLAGGTFITVDDGKTTDAAPGGVIFLSAIPLLAGLVVAAAIAFAWRPILPIAAVIGAVLALATIWGTITANLDVASTVSLSIMHVTVALGVVGTLAALRRTVFRG